MKTKTTKTKKQNKVIEHTDITVVLDRSGSMGIIRDDTIGGFNTFLTEQKKAAGNASITLNQFDDVFETVVENKDIKSVPELTSQTYVPRNSTALLDAIGRSIRQAETRNSNGSKVVFVIVTDGHENASREYNRSQIFDMIKEKRDKGWEFVFLGANQDAIDAGIQIGTVATHSMTYAPTGKGMRMAFAATSKNMGQMRCMSKADMSYTAADRQEQEEELNKI